MEIRKLQSSDMDSLAELFVKVWAEEPYNETWTKERAITCLQEIRDIYAFSFVAVEGGKVIGHALCYRRTWHDGGHLMIDDFAVHPDYRKKGVGRELLKKVEGIAKSENLVVIDLFANKKAGGFEFWKRMGYNPSAWTHLNKRL